MTGQPLKLIEQSDNCKHWSGLDAAEYAVKRVSASPAPVKKLIALWYEPNPDGSSEMRYCISGVSREEHIAMLQVFLFRATQAFLK